MIKNKYNEELLTRLLLERLRTGIVPNIDELNQTLQDWNAREPRLGLVPVTELTDTTVEHYEESSAGFINDINTAIRDDLLTFNQALLDYQEQLNTQLSLWDAYYVNTKQRLADLEDHIDTLLLLHGDTLGYYKFVSDDFNTMNYVDTELTSASVNTEVGVVEIGTVIGDTTSFSRIDLSDLAPTVNVVNANGYTSSSVFNDHQPVNALIDFGERWLHQVQTTGLGPVTLAYQFKFNELTNFTKAIIGVAGSTNTGSFNVSLFYSVDGVNWLLVPNNQASISTTNIPIVMVFPVVSANWVRVLITKNGPDTTSPGYGYIFGLSTVKLYNSVYDEAIGNTVYSTARTVESNGTPIPFTKATLSVCEQILSDTDISYYLSFDDNAFIPVIPIERSGNGIVSVVDFGNSSIVDNIGGAVWDVTKDSQALDTDNVAGVSLVNVNDVPINFDIGYELSDLVSNTLTVFRNVGNRDSTDTVRGVASGWSFNSIDNTYNSIFKVEDPNGITFDFGSTSAIIDDEIVSGTTIIEQGVHTFKTSAANWQAVPLNLTNQSDFVTNDPLYPFNHKLLIEGYTYTGFTGDQPYKGVDRYWEQTLEYCSPTEFNHYSNRLNVYTRTANPSDDMVFLLKFNNEYSDFNNEKVLIEFKVFERQFTTVKLKAVLHSTNGTTPLLDSYTIKLG